MSTLRRFLFEALWLAAAGASAWFFPKTTLAFLATGAVVTVALRMVEKSFE